MSHRTQMLGWLALGGTLGSAVFALRSSEVRASDHNEPWAINLLQADGDSARRVPGRMADAGDIYGNFAWPTQHDTVALILTFPAPENGFEYLAAAQTNETDRAPATAPNRYDPGVLYTFHIEVDRAAPESPTLQQRYYDLTDKILRTADFTIRAVFGRDPSSGEWGIRVTGLPLDHQETEIDPVIGPVDTPHEAAPAPGGAIRIQAGLFDEPFFFDLDGFFESLSRDDLLFTNRDFFVGYNVNAIVIEIPQKRFTDTFRHKFEQHHLFRPALNIWTTTHRRWDDPRLKSLRERLDSDPEQPARDAPFCDNGELKTNLPRY